MPYHTKSTDEALREGCIQQHRLAQQFLYQRYFGRLMGIAMRYTNSRDDATDILNQSFLKIFNSLHQFQETGSFFGWMAKVVFHTAIDHIRSQKTYHRIMDFSTEKDQSVESEAVEQLDAEYIYQMIQTLPTTSRTVFSLYVLDGYKHKEIGDLLDISEGTSKWHLSHARQELKKLVEQHYQPNQ